MSTSEEFKKIPYHADFMKKLTKPYRMTVEDMLDGFEFACKKGRIKLDHVALDALFLAPSIYHTTTDIDSTLRAIDIRQYFSMRQTEYTLLKPEEVISVVLPNAELTFGKNSEDSDSVEGAKLTDLLWMSLFCQEVNDMKYLISIADSPFIEWRSERSKLFFDFVAVMFGLNQSDPKLLLQQFVDKSSSEELQPLAFQHATYIQLPVIDVIITLFSQNSEREYQNAMYLAVEAHSKHWSSKSLCKEREGFFSIPLLALAKFAYQKFGYRLSFESDYVPEQLYTRDMPKPGYSFLEKYKD